MPHWWFGDIRWCMHFLKLKFVTPANSPPVYTVCHRQNVFRPKIIPLLSKRYLPLVSVRETYNKELTSKTYWKNKMTTKNLHIIIIKTLFSWYEIKSEMYNRTGRIRPRKLIGWRFYMFLWKEAFCFEFSVHAVSRFRRRTPLLRTLLLEHCDTQLCLHLLQNINDNNYNNSHARTHTIILSEPTSSLKKFEPVGA